ncbi:MAG: polysaccharide deacetylase family protein, partial [Betaproteobacteria bacterium]|nr:polysaccharide deacetylase family protein [Betaproteobacteria bacterium]
KVTLRDAVARLLFLAGLTLPGRRGRGQLSIVTLHRVLPDAERRVYPYPGLVVTPHEFDVLLTYLTQHFDCGTLAAQHWRQLGGERPPRPLLALTLDDGQHDNYRYARPLLANHEVKATFFVPVAAIERRELLWHDRLGFAVQALLGGAGGGQEQLMQILAEAGLSVRGPRGPAQTAVQEAKRLAVGARMRLVEALAAATAPAQPPEFARLMTFDELAELAGDGHEIGSHSMTHCMMPQCDDRELAYELSESRRVLQARVSQPIESFCYPNGDFDARTAGAVARAGYRRAVTTRWGLNSPGADPFRLRRCDVDYERVRDSSGRLVPAVLALRMSGFHFGLR